MTPTDLILILALVGYTVYRQTQVGEVKAEGRFKMAIIYAIVGVCVGGFNWPSGAAGWAMVAGGLVLSAVVGLWRGQLTRMWVEPDGRVMKQGTAITIALFLALIAAKFALGTWAYFAHVDDGEGFGAVLVMIALMVAVQAEIVWRRGAKLASRSRTARYSPTPISR